MAGYLRKDRSSTSQGAELESADVESNLTGMDSHEIAEEEYEDLPELTADMLARATIKKGGTPRAGQAHCFNASTRTNASDKLSPPP